MQEAGIEYATAGFYWLNTEPDNKIAWDTIDHAFGVLDLREMGFTLSAHPLIWMLPELMPEYLKDMPFDQLNQETDEHVSALVSHYRDDINTWVVINEATARHASADLTREQITELTKTGIRAVRENDPNGRIIINNLFDWYGSGRAIEMLTSDTEPFELSIPVYWDQLEAEGIDYDIIGQQHYGGGFVDFFAEWNLGAGDYVGVVTWDLARHSMILDRLSEYGKPIHVTEQSVGSTWDPNWSQYGAGWWHRPWDEATQAEFVRQFYTIAFSKERVEAITWWDINDRESFIVTGGLLDENNNPKQAYYALKDLIAGWTTSGTGQTDANGQIAIQGFGGEYQLTIVHDEQTWHKTVHMWEQQNNQVTVELE
jgi:GH35 family endo-1,4-beta-xylanase